VIFLIGFHLIRRAEICQDLPPDYIFITLGRGRKKPALIQWMGGVLCGRSRLALTRFEAWVLFVDHINTTLALDQLAITIAFFKAFQ